MDWKMRNALEDLYLSIKNTRVTSLLNAVMLLFYLMYSTAYQPYRIFFIASIILLIEGIRRVYDWRHGIINSSIIFCYLLSVVLEYKLTGLFDLGINAEKYSKGMLLEFITYLFPYLYFAIRIGGVAPLLLVIANKYKINRLKNQLYISRN